MLRDNEANKRNMQRKLEWLTMMADWAESLNKCGKPIQHNFRFIFSKIKYLGNFPLVFTEARFQTWHWSAFTSDSANFPPVRLLPRKTHLRALPQSCPLSLCNPLLSKDVLNYRFQNKELNEARKHSTWPSCFGSSTRTSGLIGDVREAGQAACQFGQPTVGEQLMDGGGFGDASRCDHRYRPEQGAAAGTDGAQDHILGEK